VKRGANFTLSSPTILLETWCASWYILTSFVVGGIVGCSLPKNSTSAKHLCTSACPLITCPKEVTNPLRQISFYL